MTAEQWIAFGAVAAAVMAAGLTFLNGQRSLAHLKKVSEQQRASDEMKLRAQDEQLAAQRAQLDAQERQLRESVQREHFQRLWERRQQYYTDLVAWALALREDIEEVETLKDWNPPRLGTSALAGIFLYADWDVYQQANLLRGAVGAVADHADLWSQVSETSRQGQLNKLGEDAFTLVMKAREFALQSPAWREPIALEAEPSASAFSANPVDR